MRTTVIIAKRGEGYISTVSGRHGGGHQGARCGLTPYDAAASAARLMVDYAQSNPEGGDLMAPPEVLESVPAHLRSIEAQRKAVYGYVDQSYSIGAEPVAPTNPDTGSKEKAK